MQIPNFKKEEILHAFQYRHATKEFDATKKISEEDFDFILETARLSPSSAGLEPWKFIVVQDKELRELLKPISMGAGEKLDTASHFVLGLTAKAPLMKWDSDRTQEIMSQRLPEEVAKMMTAFYKNFQENDFDLNSDRTLFDWASKQSYIALGNMMTSAAMIGIDSCPIEGFQQKKIDELLQEHFGINTDEYGISYMLAFGYRAKEPREKTRQNIEDIIIWK